MCGIYGSTKMYNENLVMEKLGLTSFRGPDHSGYIKKDGIILGHNRLSIIDLESRSNQPFEYQHIMIAFNGEIYNFKEIKSELKQKGYTFNTSSDTEVLCAAYLAYGHNCLSHLNGMFSFVIHDKKKGELFGAVDRLGQKPFYYFENGEYFEFGSQLSMIALGNQFSIDQSAIDAFLLKGYIAAPKSIYKEVKKLSPGFYFTYSTHQNTFQTLKYWDVTEETKSFQGCYTEAKDELEKLLSDAVSKRLISDVPIGTFLSGGIDSSLITAIAQKSSSTKIKTFSIKFNEKGYDESIYAEAIASHLGTQHLTIDCDINEGLDLIDQHNRYFDEPFADSSAIPSMLLAKHAKKYVTVALSGDAGDESFLGYTRYDWVHYFSKLNHIPIGLRKTIGHILSYVPQYRLKVIANKLKKEKDVKSFITSIMQTNYVDILKNLPVKEEVYPGLFCKNLNAIQQNADYDIKQYLPYDILVKIDRATMAYSLEGRSPFLDHRVVEFARSLPVDFRYQRGNKKRILKDILYDYVPKELLDRPKKGFTMPFSSWFRKELKELVYDTLTTENLSKIPNLNINYVKQGIEDHMSEKLNFYPEIWKLIILTKWMNAN